MPAPRSLKQEARQKPVYTPPVAVYEDADAYTLLVQLPGTDSTSIHVSLDDHRLTIEAPFAVDIPPAATRRYSEMHIGNYKRCLGLSDHIDEQGIEATFQSGMLKITMRKSKINQARPIQVKIA